MKYLFYSVVAICITVLLGLLIVHVDSDVILAIAFTIFVAYWAKHFYKW